MTQARLESDCPHPGGHDREPPLQGMPNLRALAEAVAGMVGEVMHLGRGWDHDYVDSATGFYLSQISFLHDIPTGSSQAGSEPGIDWAVVPWAMSGFEWLSAVSVIESWFRPDGSLARTVLCSSLATTDGREVNYRAGSWEASWSRLPDRRKIRQSELDWQAPNVSDLVLRVPENWQPDSDLLGDAISPTGGVADIVETYGESEAGALLQLLDTCPAVILAANSQLSTARLAPVLPLLMMYGYEFLTVGAEGAVCDWQPVLGAQSTHIESDVIVAHPATMANIRERLEVIRVA
jgi:hypothetical protein